jgi:hypothetical protein
MSDKLSDRDLDALAKMYEDNSGFHVFPEVTARCLRELQSLRSQLRPEKEAAANPVFLPVQEDL